jgi:glycine hydroxymethyltransferase
MHVVAAKAVCFLEAMQPEFIAYSKQVLANANVLAAGMQKEGFRVVSGGTDTHVMLVDVFSKGVRGKDAEQSLDRARITVNKNAIPFDVNPPLNPSGIRLGSPAATTRGFGESEMREVAALIAEVLNNVNSAVNSESAIASVRHRVEALTSRFPLYAWKMQAAPAQV